MWGLQVISERKGTIKEDRNSFFLTDQLYSHCETRQSRVEATPLLSLSNRVEANQLSGNNRLF